MEDVVPPPDMNGRSTGQREKIVKSVGDGGPHLWTKHVGLPDQVFDLGQIPEVLEIVEIHVIANDHAEVGAQAVGPRA